MQIDRIIELLEIEHECMLRKSHNDCDGKCDACDLVQNDDELHEMYTDVIALLKAQEPRVMTLEEVIKSESAFWLEFREEDNDDYIRYGWAFFSGSTPDVIEIIARDSFRPINAFIAREYGERWRCWTSRPTDEQREAVKWE